MPQYVKSMRLAVRSAREGRIGLDAVENPEVSNFLTKPTVLGGGGDHGATSASQELRRARPTRADTGGHQDAPPTPPVAREPRDRREVAMEVVNARNPSLNPLGPILAVTGSNRRLRA